MKNVIRLYKQFQPNKYNLSFVLDKRTKTFDGEVVIEGKLPKTTLYLVLHAKNLTIKHVAINDMFCDFKTIGDELRIRFPKKHSGLIVVNIAYSGKITDLMHGIYECNGRNNEIIIATQFESHHAREAFPCVDEPEAKAVFCMSISADKNDQIIANTTSKEESISADKKTVVFKDTPIMSTYLLAFVVGDIKKRSAKTKQHISVNAWSTYDQFENTKFALDVGVKSLEFFIDYFGVDYPLEKCDLIALPDFAAGAMENWGLITFREICMLVDDKNTSLDIKQYAAMVIAHEVAHQWFGNLVTMKWWDDLWLNEGFASWIEFLAVDSIFPDWHMWTHFIVSEQNTAFKLDALKNTHPIEVELPHPDEIRTIFDSISYAKGASVIHMLHEYLGKENFKKGVSDYLNKFSYKNTTTADLWNSLEQTTGKPVANFMSEWTTQSGFPVVKVSNKDGQIILEQTRFLLDGSSSENTLWSIPLLSSSANLEIFDEQETSLRINNAVEDFRLNENQSGFYITKYTPSQYKIIGRQIIDKEIDEVNRLNILSNALYLNKACTLAIEELLGLISCYGSETSAPVWDIIATVMGEIRQIMGSKVRETIKPLALYLSDSQTKRLGWETKEQDSHNDKLLRPVVFSMAASGDNKNVLSKIRVTFDNANKIADIPSDMRNMTLLAISKRGGKNEFNKMIDMLDKATQPEDKFIILHGLSNFRAKTEMNKFISLIISKQVRLQDVGYCIMYALANPKHRDLSWNWIKDNWQWIKENLGGDMTYPRIPMYVARVQNNIAFLDEYNKFFDKVNEPALDRAIKQGQETIKAQSAWRKHDHDKILAWLDSNYHS
jgi:aminopeptidase N